MQVASLFNDKLLHFGGYFILALLPVLTSQRRATVLAICGLVVLGLVLEFGQLDVQGRSFDLRDWAADDVGLVCGAAAGWGVLRRRRVSR